MEEYIDARDKPLIERYRLAVIVLQAIAQRMADDNEWNQSEAYKDCCVAAWNGLYHIGELPINMTKEDWFELHDENGRCLTERLHKNGKIY